MRLLVAIINDEDKVLDILDRFLSIGVQGATVIESRGMAHLMADHVPFFARFAEMGVRESNRTILVLLKEESILQKVLSAIELVVGDLENPDTGVVFTVPIDFCKGIEKRGRS